jgi:hypothetical protein
MVKIIVVLGLIGVIVFGVVAYRAADTIGELLLENSRLKKAISNLTQEDQIGYAKVTNQVMRGDKQFTTLKFIVTDRKDKNVHKLVKEYTIEGNVIHFDAIIVKFDNKEVIDGEKKALYLWRRVYGEYMAPNDGLTIETEGITPARYDDIFEPQSWFAKLMQKQDEAEIFWDAIWELAHDPEKLKLYGVDAAYGNVVYTKLMLGLIYEFSISSTGQIVPRTVPDI